MSEGNEKEAERLLPLIPIQVRKYQEKVVVDDCQYEEKSLMNQQICKDRVVLTEALDAKDEIIRECLGALQLVLRRGSLVQRSDQYMNEVLSEAKAILTKYKEMM